MIRHATPADVPELLALGRQYYAESGYERYGPMDDESCRELIDMSMRCGSFLVAENQGAVVGMLAVLLVPYMLNKSITLASEVLFFVDKAQTGKGFGSALLDACITECKASGARAIQSHRLPSSDGALGHLYQSRGFEPSEFSSTKVL